MRLFVAVFNAAQPWFPSFLPQLTHVELEFAPNSHGENLLFVAERGQRVTMTEIVFASLALLTFVNCFAISATKIQPQLIVWRRKRARPSFGTDVINSSPSWLEPSPRSSHVPTPFPERLAQYLRCNESRLGDTSFPSRMVFWVLETCFTGKPAKSRDFIRSLLNRIRRHVRDD